MTNCTILVEPEECEYVIDIEQSEVFKSMLQKGFPEHNEGIIRLPKDEPNDFLLNSSKPERTILSGAQNQQTTFSET
ncbi:hypothetical protein VTN00DRAFT_6458 [Thermoascus crustaceus]|uniref:uncharacterized protein n=1 Tax=Thermoascus crustaceus TaxID=5088 RepID=UPI003743B7C5